MIVIHGYEALKAAKDVTRIGGTFGIRFKTYNYTKNESSGERIYRKCKTRKQLPEDRFTLHPDCYFLFQEAETNDNKQCFARFIRQIEIQGTWYKVDWFAH